MFKDIFDLAKQTPLSLLISTSGKELLVIVQPCPTKGNDISESAKKGLMHPLSLQGTPEELDAAFTDLIASYTLERGSLVQQLAIASDAIKASTKKAAKATPPLLSKQISDTSSAPSESTSTADPANVSNKEVVDGTKKQTNTPQQTTNLALF